MVCQLAHQPGTPKKLTRRVAGAAPPARSGAPPKPLPPGFTFRIVKSPAKPRGYGEYMADCPVHGRSERRMDRWDHVAKFFEGHAGCRCCAWLRGAASSADWRVWLSFSV